MDAVKTLKEKGIRPSVQRTAIMRYLQENRVHPSADTVFLALRGDMPTLSRTTVYNTLRMFCDKGVAQMVVMDGEDMRFDADISLHGHFRCTKCGSIHDVFFADPASLNIPRPHGFRTDSIQISYSGLCPECRN